MSDADKLDVLVYGATGFTGKLVAEYLHQTYGDDGEVRWGMAGRNADKLAEVKAELGIGDSVASVIADSGDKASIDAMASATKVLLTTTGPYQQYGTTVVESCARLGTDYVDLSGEPLWMKQMGDEYGASAKESGARIVFSCGFDSLPSDLGVHYLQQEARTRLGASLPRVRCRVQDMRGTASGGTVASFTATMAAVKENPALFADLANPFVLTDGFSGPEQPQGNTIIHDEDLNQWSGPFVMAAINTKNVHRSNELLGHAYGEDLVYDEMIFLGETQPEAAGGDFGLDMSLKPGEGPSKEEREAGYYDIAYIGTNDSGDKLTVQVIGDRDPGYGSTSKMIAEAAICLGQTPNAGGGMFTAAPVMGDALRERLHNNAGVTFNVVS
ncbi:MAG: saccharopine dehydrogenase NADP-binding domain-containing protein [Pseudomonadota bacterium]